MILCWSTRRTKLGTIYNHRLNHNEALLYALAIHLLQLCFQILHSLHLLDPKLKRAKKEEKKKEKMSEIQDRVVSFLVDDESGRWNEYLDLGDEVGLKKVKELSDGRVIEGIRINHGTIDIVPIILEYPHVKYIEIISIKEDGSPHFFLPGSFDNAHGFEVQKEKDRLFLKRKVNKE